MTKESTQKTVTVTITHTHESPCIQCNGIGSPNENNNGLVNDVVCLNCNGTGKLLIQGSVSVHTQGRFTPHEIHAIVTLLRKENHNICERSREA